MVGRTGIKKNSEKTNFNKSLKEPGVVHSNGHPFSEETRHIEEELEEESPGLCFKN